MKVRHLGKWWRVGDVEFSKSTVRHQAGDRSSSVESDGDDGHRYPDAGERIGTEWGWDVPPWDPRPLRHETNRPVYLAAYSADVLPIKEWNHPGVKGWKDSWVALNALANDGGQSNGQSVSWLMRIWSIVKQSQWFDQKVSRLIYQSINQSEMSLNCQTIDFIGIRLFVSCWWSNIW